MHDTLLMRVFPRLSHLSRDGQRFICRQRPLNNALFESRTVHQLHDQRARRPFLQTIDRSNVRMIQRSQKLRLPLEPGKPVVIGSEFLR